MIFVVPLLCQDSTWHRFPAAKALIARYLSSLAATTTMIESVGRPIRLVLSLDPEVYLTVVLEALVVEWMEVVKVHSGNASPFATCCQESFMCLLNHVYQHTFVFAPRAP